MRRLGFGVVLVAVGAVVASLVLVVGRLAPVARAESGSAPAGCAPVSPSDAAAVRQVFVVSAVLRRNPRCSYELVTPALRQGLGRKEWASGNIPVIPFATDRPRTVRMEVIPQRQTAAARKSYVVLESADAGRYAFELLMVRSGDRWRVAYWAPAGTLGASSS